MKGFFLLIFIILPLVQISCSKCCHRRSNWRVLINCFFQTSVTLNMYIRFSRITLLFTNSFDESHLNMREKKNRLFAKKNDNFLCFYLCLFEIRHFVETLFPNKDAYLPGVQEKLCFFTIHCKLQLLPRLHRCKRPAKLSTQCECTVTRIGW